MVSDEREPRESPEGDSSAHEVELARLLGEYLSRSSSRGSTGVQKLLADHPEILADLRAELQALGSIDSLIEDESAAVRCGDFLILREIGRGGMGIVYEARQSSLDRLVALKILPPSLLVDPRSVERFQREARVAASLQHPNIVGVHSTGVEGGVPYYAMELVEGETLHQLKSRWTPVEAGEDSLSSKALKSTGSYVQGWRKARGSDATDVDEDTRVERPDSADREVTPRPVAAEEPAGASYYHWVADVFAGAAEGVQHAHSRGVVHRDLKPSNLIVDRGGDAEEGGSGRLRVLDFGLAHVEGDPRLTGTRFQVGTPLYMSPEQAASPAQTLGPGTDIYSLGATLYEMISGKPPFEADSSQELLQKIRDHEVPLPRRRNPEVPEDLETIVLKCLRKRPEERYGTAEALAQDLRRFVRGDPIEARPQSLRERLWLRARRQKRRLFEAAVICALLVTVVLLLYRHSADATQRRLNIYESRIRGAVMGLLNRQLLSPARSLTRVDGERVFLGRDPWSRPNISFEAMPDRFVRQAATHSFGLGHPDPLEEAILDLREAVTLLPGNPSAHYWLARGLLLQGRRNEAAWRLDKTLESNPGFLPALSLRAWMLQEEGDPRAGEIRKAVVDIAARSGGRWPPAWLEAHEAMLSGEWKNAAAHFDRLARTEQDGGELYLGQRIETVLGRGVASLRAGELDQALEDFGAGREIWPDWIEPSLFLGKVHQLKGNEKRAAKIFQDLHDKAGGQASDGPSPEAIAQAVTVAYSEVGAFEKALEWAGRMGADIEKLRRQAELLCRLGRYDAARQEATRALLENRDDVATHLLFGILASLEGKHSDARTWIRRATAIDDAAPEPWIQMGLCLEAEENLEGARQALSQALRRDPWNSRALYHLARVQGSQEDLEGAVESYRRTIAAESRNALACNNLGTILDRQGRLEEARRMYRRATELAPDLALAHYNLAWLYHRERRYGEAAGEYAEALRFGLDDGWLRRNYGACLQHQWKTVEAIDVYRAGLELAPDDDLLLHDLGSALFSVDREEGIRVLQKALELVPGDVHTTYLIAYSFEYEQRADEAIPWYRRVLELDPRHSETTWRLARLLLQKGDPPPTGQALRDDILWLEDAYSPSERPPGVARLLDVYRQALHPDLASYASVDWVLDDPRHAGDIEESIAILETPAGGSGVQRASALLAYLRGKLLEREGKLPEAVARYREATALDSERPEPLARLAECLLALESPAEAERALRKAFEPGRAELPHLRDQWVRLVLVDLGWSLEETIARFPMPPGTSAQDMAGRGADLLWLLSELADDGVFRINCGGNRFENHGVVWGRDRFSMGGSSFYLIKLDDKRVGDDDYVIHRTERYFWQAGEVLPGYAFPVPSGRYHVTLHTLEGWFEEAGKRIFDALIEGEPCVENHEPFQWGFGQPHAVGCTVDVEDGLLELDVRRWVENPKLSAIEVRKL